MNTKNKWLTVARISTESERAEHWRTIFDGDVLPIISPVGHLVRLPDGSKETAYQLNLSAISDEQRRRLVDYIARQFGLDRDEVEGKLDDIGCPILARDVVVSSSDRGLMFSLMGDWYDDYYDDRDGE